MPRIPTRTTPYDTPTRQHRHFKNKRDQVLRALGRSSYINGSQFAIMWVSARGETETYASPVLQGLLESEPGQPALFSPEILQRAKEAALKAPPELKVTEISLEHIRKPQPRTEASHAASPIASDYRSALSAKGPLGSSSPNQHGGGAEGATEVEVSAIERPPSVEGLVPASSASDCSMDEPSPFLNGDSNLSSSHFHTQSETCMSQKTHQLSLPAQASNPSTSPDCAAAREEGAGCQSQDDPKGFLQNCGMGETVTESASLEQARNGERNHLNYLPQNDSLQMASEFVPLETSRTLEGHHEETISFESNNNESNQNTQAIELLPNSVRDKPATESPTIISFPDPPSIANFLENKFRQLQQNTCKLVCKAWIKVVEPKKQRKFPYRSGETSKPDWWPRGVVHREPDHLLKPDRIQLMLALLGAGKVPVGRLELASAEMAAFIPPDKMDILKDIYTVAKEEERLRATWPVGVPFVPFQVELSNNNSCEAPSKSSGSPQTMNSEILTGSPTMIDYMPNVQHASEATINFLNRIPVEARHTEEWPPSALPGYIQNNIKPQSFSHHVKANGFLSGEYNSHNVHDVMTECHTSWAMNPDIFQESIAPHNTNKRTGRARESLMMASLESLNQGTSVANGYIFPPTLQTSSFSHHELLGSLSMKGGGSSSIKDSTVTTNPPHDSGFLQDLSPSENNNAWAHCGMFFDNPVASDSSENLWHTVSIPSASFECAKVLSEESYLL